jgi:hypothetical protein
MRTFAVGLWKEWRDHRLVSVALLVALPVLVLASAWAFGDEVLPADFGPLTLFALCGAQALYVFAVASESFGGERRRGTLDFLRRLPRGLGRAFAAKLTMYVLGTVFALAWGALVAWLACVLFGPARAVEDFAKALLLPDPMITVVATAVFALGLWTLLVSNMVPQGGAATVGAAILLGLLGVPVYLGLKAQPWVLGSPEPELLLPASALLGLPALLALGYAFLRGNRLLASAWSPSWRGLAVVAVMACGGYAWGAVEIDRALTIDPYAESFRIQNAYLGKGGRLLFVSVQRDALFDSMPSGANSRTPWQPWIVDLESGSWRVAGEFGGGWLPLVVNNRHVAQPIVQRYGYMSRDVGWFDGETGALKKVLPHDVRTQDVLEWQRASMPALAWHRDADGRAVWLEGQDVVREGDDVPLPRWFPGKQDLWTWPLPGGWSAAMVSNENPRRIPTNVWRLWDAETGKVRTVEQSPNRTRTEFLLSPKSALRLSYRPAPRTQKQVLEPWALVDLDSGVVSATNNPPASQHLLAALPGERALFMAGSDRLPLTLSVWDPRSGETTPVLDERGEPIVGTSAERTAFAPGGLSVYLLWKSSPRAIEPSFVLLDETKGTARRLPVPDFRCEIVCIESPDSVVAVTSMNKVVRLRWQTSGGGTAGFREETLFPRAGGARKE